MPARGVGFAASAVFLAVFAAFALAPLALVTRRLALANFMAFAPDALSTVGGYPGDDYRGGQMFGKIDAGKMMEDFVGVGAVAQGA